MDISSISSVSTVTDSSEAMSLGKEDFMMLLLEQLNNQDPLDPMDSTQFTSQLAEFTQLEELENLNSTLEEVLAYQQSMQNAAVTSMSGKTVSSSGNTTYLTDSASINYELSEDASTVEILITDELGQLVWSGEMGSQEAGAQSLLWDGTDSSGNQLAEGTYTFEINAMDSAGNAVEASTNASGVVTGVSFEDGMTYLMLDGNRKIYLSDILTIEG